MPSTFETWLSYHQFAEKVRSRERFVRSQECLNFLQTLHATSAKRTKTLQAEALLWRAQLGYDVYEEDDHGTLIHMEVPFKADRMKPPRVRQSEGRANPGGLSALYMATTERTAIAEVRPWVGKLVSVAQMKVVRELRVLDCSAEHSDQSIFYFQEPPPEVREEAVWREVCRALSEPITSDAISVDYVPTQIIAEYFRSNGYDGLAYKSLLGDGTNIALFELDAAEVINCCLHRVKSVKFEHEQAGNPYFVSEHYPNLQ